MLRTAPDPVPQSIDATLVPALIAGEPKALEALMRRYNQSLYRVARSILKDEQEAEEAVQDAYLKAYRCIGQFQGQAKLSTWLTRIVINEALVRRRKHERRASIVPIDSTTPLDATTAGDLPMASESTQSPEREAQRAEVRRLIERSIDSLPDSFRSVFVLRALEECSVEETARCLDIPQATVRSRYFRARGLMREAIAREIDISQDDAFSFAGARCERIVKTVLARIAASSESPSR